MALRFAPLTFAPAQARFDGADVDGSVSSPTMFRLDAPIGRARFLGVGIGLAILEYALEAAVVRLATGAIHPPHLDSMMRSRRGACSAT